MTIISPLPYNIVNGQAVDATPVMSNLNQIVANVNANAALLGGNAAQEFLVATATGAADAMPLAQVQADFAAIGGSATQLFQVATATGAADAVPLAQVQADFAAIGGSATQLFQVATATGATDAMPLAQAQAGFAPLDGVGTFGTWPISITGSAQISFGGNGILNITSNTTLTAANAGQVIAMGGNNSGGTLVVLPSAAATAAGLMPLIINNTSSMYMTVACPAGQSIGSFGASVIVQGYGQLALLNDGVSTWAIISNTSGNASQEFLVSVPVDGMGATPLSYVQGNYAPIGGSATQTFMVATATSSADAVPLAQVQADFAPLGGAGASGTWPINITGKAQIALGGNGLVVYSGNTTLTAANAGQIALYNGSAAGTFTLPFANAVGATLCPLIISNVSSYTVTIVAPSGDGIDLNPNILQPDQYCALFNDGNTVWRTVWNTAGSTSPIVIGNAIAANQAVNLGQVQSGYAPLGGAGTSGTWPINIAGKAQIALGGNGLAAYNVNTALSAANAGHIVFYTGSAAGTFTLPFANAVGATLCPLIISNQSAYALTIIPPSGDGIDLNPNILQPNQYCSVFNDGSANWHTVWNTAGSTSPIVTGNAVAANQAVNLGQVQVNSYTVAALPSGQTIGRRALVTDALAPTWNAALTGGGAVTCPAVFNGTTWVAG